MRNPFTSLRAMMINASSVLRVFRRQRVSPMLVLAFCLLCLALVFSFLAFAPVLSPFIYPLF